MTPPPRPSREHVTALAARGAAITAEANALLTGAMREAIDAAGDVDAAFGPAARDVADYLARRPPPDDGAAASVAE